MMLHKEQVAQLKQRKAHDRCHLNFTPVFNAMPQIKPGEII